MLRRLSVYRLSRQKYIYVHHCLICYEQRTYHIPIFSLGKTYKSKKIRRLKYCKKRGQFKLIEATSTQIFVRPMRLVI